MFEVICSLCKKSNDYSKTNIIRSIVCGHALCEICIEKHFSFKFSVSGRLEWTAFVENLVCPVCEKPCKAEDLVSWASDLTEFDKLRLARHKVLSLISCNRKCFNSTPDYDAILEDQESIIYSFVYETDSTKLKSAEEKLHHYATMLQQQILESAECGKQIKEQQAFEIMVNEGSFYDEVNQNYEKGFKMKELNINNHNLIDKLQTNTNKSDDEFADKQKVSNIILEKLQKDLPNTLSYAPVKASTKIRAIAGGFQKNNVICRTQQEVFAYYI